MAKCCATLPRRVHCILSMLVKICPYRNLEFVWSIAKRFVRIRAAYSKGEGNEEVSLGECGIGESIIMRQRVVWLPIYRETFPRKSNTPLATLFATFALIGKFCRSTLLKLTYSPSNQIRYIACTALDLQARKAASHARTEASTIIQSSSLPLVDSQDNDVCQLIWSAQEWAMT